MRIIEAKIREQTDLPSRSVPDAIRAYCEHLVEQREAKADTGRWQARATKRLAEQCRRRVVGELTVKDARRFLASMSDLSPSTQRSYWMALERLTRWWLLKGFHRDDICSQLTARYAREDRLFPWQARSAQRGRGRGKKQLRGEAEFRRYVKAALRHPEVEYRVAGLLPVLCGLASGEVLHLQLRDVEVRERIIWVRPDEAGAEDWDVKRASRERSVQLPDDLAADVAELVHQRRAQGGTPSTYLFKQTECVRARTASWLRMVVRKHCEAAGTVVVSPHGLRGTYATLGRERHRRSNHSIALSLGHADRGRTASRHYIGAPSHSDALPLEEE